MKERHYVQPKEGITKSRGIHLPKIAMYERIYLSDNIMQCRVMTPFKVYKRIFNTIDFENKKDNYKIF